MNSGYALECFGNFSTSRAMSLLSWRRAYSSPQIRQDITDKRSEISEAPRSLSPRSLCLSSRTMIFSFDIFWPRSAFSTSDPQRTESKPSASQALFAQKSGTTSIKIATLLLVFMQNAFSGSRHLRQGSNEQLVSQKWSEIGDRLQSNSCGQKANQ